MGNDLYSMTKTIDPKSRKSQISKNWENYRIGITGASGELGKTLTKNFRSRGAYVIGFTHQSQKSNTKDCNGPNEWVKWTCGKEALLENKLNQLDLLILNHGINPQGRQGIHDLNKALEVNALSTWAILQRFESICLSNKTEFNQREVWVNTSEAEIQPALSPGYEISKRLIGGLVSLRLNNQTEEERNSLKIKKIILGPFKSELNPIGIMNSEFVADQIIKKSALSHKLIIVTPNPITYLLIPILETLRTIYSALTRRATFKTPGQ